MVESEAVADKRRVRITVPGVVRRSRTRIARAMPLAWRVMARHKRVLGTPLPLRRPRSFSEKLAWMKIFGEVDLLTVCADKVAVRDYVRKKLGDEDLLNAIYFVTEDPADITPERIQHEQFVVKANHDSGSTIICRDRETFDFAAARVWLAKCLRRDYFPVTLEPQYRKIPRRIIVERYLQNADGSPMGDYRILCYNGHAEYLYVNVYDKNVKYRAYYDISWKRYRVTQSAPDYHGEIEKPPFLDRLIETSERLASDFDFVRVDYNIVDDRIYFGEMTFCPQGGLAPYDPPEMDLRLGEKLRLTRSRFALVRLALSADLMG